MTFDGFPKQTLTFLRGLSKNNTREWFNGHRGDYENYYLAPAVAFVEAVAAPLSKIAPDIKAQPKVSGSIFRISRDMRFASDQAPYKDHLDLWFWEGERRRAISGFFLRIEPSGITIGAGSHGFDQEALARWRAMVTDPFGGPELTKAIASVKRGGWTIEGEHYKKLPRGYEDATGKTAELLRYNALWVSQTKDIPKDFTSKAFVAWCTKKWKSAAAIHHWLVENVQV